MPARRRRTRQPGALVPLLVVALVLAGCAGLQPAAPEWATLRTSTSTRHYVVRGATSRAIFEAIDANGLADAKGRPAVGLTVADWRLDWSGLQEGGGLCTPTAPTITLTLVVTLPELERAAGLSPDIEARWQRFAARIAAHEQRHVDIYLDGAKLVKARLEAELARPSSCASLKTTIQGVWTRQQAEIEENQDRFHLEDDARAEADRKPLQARIDTHTARLAAIQSEVRDADLALEDLARQISATRGRIGGLKAQMSPSEHDRLVTAHRALVERHDDIVRRRNALADEHTRTLAVTNDLIDVLNWTR